MIHKSFTVASLIAAATSAYFPEIDVTVDGVPTTLYVHYPEPWSMATVSGDSVSFDFNNRMYLSTSPTLDTSSYFKPDILGGSMEFDVDLSQSGCGCLTALYAIVMPASQN